MNKVVLITGISSGFGLHTATYLAQKGYRVYGTCRSACEQDPKITVLRMDVTRPEEVLAGVNQILEKEGRIDVLINNAGMHTGGALEIYPEDGIHKQLETNFMGAVYTIKAVLPSMRKQGEGTIINISSIGGLMGLPFQGYYSAAKFALEGFSESLRMEVRTFGIRVIVINPGDFHTRNTANRKNLEKSGDIDAYVEQFRISLGIIEHDENKGWDPGILARKIYRILQKKNPAFRYIVGSFDQRLAVKLKYLLPDSWFAAILRQHYGIR
jgi:NAD(P)-dependent dehydrogenase (short-subunit alcohol dehydrogenase family)